MRFSRQHLQPCGGLKARARRFPIEDLPRLLIAADVHLITVRDPFHVGSMSATSIGS
jgi:hypothetical protein